MALNRKTLGPEVHSKPRTHDWQGNEWMKRIQLPLLPDSWLGLLLEK